MKLHPLAAALLLIAAAPALAGTPINESRALAADGNVEIENVSGDTTLKITSNTVEVQSVSGDIDLQGGLSGEVQLETVSGNATLAAKRLERLEFSSVSGDARLQAGLAPNGVIEIESLSGGVSVTLARPLDANLDIETFSGSINSAVGTIKREEYGPGRTLNAKIGQGTGRIRVESFSGDVDFVLK